MKSETLPPVNLADLEVIGYADALSREDAPAIVPPVFRFRDQKDRCLLPPFQIADDWVVNPKEVSMDQARDLADEERITLPRACRHPARANWTLWLNERGALRYEPTPDAERTLEEIYQRHLAAATTALTRGKIDTAEQHAETALAANEDAHDPYAILAVCHGMIGEENEMMLMREVCLESGASERSFVALVAAYSEMLPPKSWENIEIVKTLERFRKAGAEVHASFQLAEEEYRRFLPILHQYKRAGDERKIVVVCGGVEAELLAEKELLNYAFSRVEQWVKELPKVSRHWTIAAEEMLDDPRSYFGSTRLDADSTIAIARHVRARAFPLG